MVFLVETKCCERQIDPYRRKLGFKNCFVVDRIGLGGGLALFWDEKVSIKIMSFSRFHIDCEVEDEDSKQWRFTGFYGNPDSTQRFHGWNLIRQLSHMSALSWLCMGDFNEILNQAGKVGGVPRANSLIQNFQNAIVDSNLHDLGFLGCKYTWFMERWGVCSGEVRPGLRYQLVVLFVP